MKKIELLKLSGEIYDANNEPKQAPINAGITIAINNCGLVLMESRYLIAAVVVPKNAAVLDVATTDTGFSSGKESNMAGVWMSPPPPAIASMKPEANIASASSARLITERS